MLYVIENETLAFSNLMKSDKEKFGTWNRIQADFFKKVKEMYNMSTTEFMDKVFKFGKDFADLADDLNRFPSLNEFVDYLKKDNVIIDKNQIENVYRIMESIIK